MEKVRNEWGADPLKFHWWRVLKMPYHQVVSYAYSRSKKMDTRCWCRRSKFYVHYVFQIQQVVKGASMAEKSTLCIGKKLSALQEPYDATVYHALHGLAQRKF
jgi:hypothetical protein